jgi:flavorubredoxin
MTQSALVVYWSGTGNTEKVAFAIKRGLEKAAVHVTIKQPSQALNEDLFTYDLVGLGTPVHQWLPANPVHEFVNTKLKEAFTQGHVQPNMSPVPGRNGLVFVTYSGPHTGKGEAVPATKWMGQFFEHLGFTVVAEWYLIGEFHGRLQESTEGRLGDIRGKPTQADLKAIEEKAARLARVLQSS